LAGHLDEAYFSNAHKKTHATFGKPRGGYSIRKREFCYSSIPQVDREEEKHPSLEKVPKITDKPIMNLVSDVNFV